MTLTGAEAAAALDEATRTGVRTARLHAYRAASPHLLLWGVIWLLGYSLCGVFPPTQWALVWLPLNLVGAAGSVLLGARSPVSPPAGYAWRTLVAGGALAALMASTALLFHGSAPVTYLAYPGLVVSVAYCMLGLQAPRLVWLGASLFVMTVLGFIFLQPWLAFWMGSAGGGSLMLGGLWLRRI
jgi:hypothetical protein